MISLIKLSLDIIGRLLGRTPLLLLPNGAFIILLEIQTTTDSTLGSTIYITIFTSNNIKLNIGGVYEFKELNISNRKNCNQTIQWYHTKYNKSTCNILHIKSHTLLIHNGNNISDTTFTVIKIKQFIEPENDIHQSYYEHKLYYIKGRIKHYNYKQGWIEVEVLRENNTHKSDLSYDHENETIPYTVCIILSNYQKYDLCVPLLPGNYIRISNVFPLYIWSKLRGFCTTIRSLIITETATSSSSTLQHTVLSIPNDMINCCRLYCLWRYMMYTFIHTQLSSTSILQSQIPLESYDTLIDTFAHIIEQFYELYYSNICISYCKNHNINVQHLHTTNANNNYNNYMLHILKTHRILYTKGQAGTKGLSGTYDVSIQDEFSDLLSYQSIIVSAGLPSTLVSLLLPKVCILCTMFTINDVHSCIFK